MTAEMADGLLLLLLPLPLLPSALSSVSDDWPATEADKTAAAAALANPAAPSSGRSTILDQRRE